LWDGDGLKALEVLKEVLPHATRFGVLFTPTAPSYAARRTFDAMYPYTAVVGMTETPTPT
jgi:hypothetical protein